MCSWKVKNLFSGAISLNYNIDYGCGGDRSYYDNDEVDSTLCQRNSELGQMLMTYAICPLRPL